MTAARPPPQRTPSPPHADAGSHGCSQQPHQQHLLPHHSRLRSDLLVWLLLLVVTAALGLLTTNRYLLSSHPSTAADNSSASSSLASISSLVIGEHLPPPPLSQRDHMEDNRRLRLVAEECAKAEDTVLWLDDDGALVVQQDIDLRRCPPLDIMLRGSERGVGMCTDAALYVLHARGRIIPAPPSARAYNAVCGAGTARLFLETMYSQFVSRAPGVLHMQLLNAEHMWARDAALHERMDAWLCKTRVCVGLLLRHAAAQGYKGRVLFVGHTSLDPSADAPADAPGHTKELTFLHIKGKSGLKHTNQLLECWRGRPDLPRLTVVGRFSWSEAAESVNASNIVFYPRVTSNYSGAAQTDLISFESVRRLQLSSPVHVCASEREGFGHYINEARAAGAAIISTDHPPMNELVTEAEGLLVVPERAASYPEMALAPYANISAFLSPQQLCGAVDALLRLPREEVDRRGQRARQAYLREKAAFLARMKDLRGFLQQRAAAAAAKQQRRQQTSGRRRLTVAAAGADAAAAA